MVGQCQVYEEISLTLPKETMQVLGELWAKVGMELFRSKGRNDLIIVEDILVHQLLQWFRQ